MVLTKETSLFKKDSIADDVGGAVTKAVSVYMRKPAAQTAPSRPTEATSIGTSPSTDNAWEYVMPYPKKNYKFYTCEQYTKVDGSKEYSDVRELSSETYISKWVHDADSTYIDGGNLYTGSVTADKIKAGSITIGNLSDEARYNVDYSVTTEKALTDYPYLKLCTIQAVRAYQNKDVVFRISSRLSRMDTEINWAFNNSSSATATVVSHAYKTGSTPVFYVSEESGKYGIYITKADKYEDLQVHGLYNPFPKGITIEWVGTEVTSLPSGYVAFTELAGSRKASDIDDAAQTADSYITYVSAEDGIKVHSVNDSSNYIQINSEGSSIYKGGESVAEYGDTVRVGSATSTNLNVEPGVITLKEGGSTKGSIDLVTNDAVGLYSTDGATGIAAKSDGVAGWARMTVYDGVATDCTLEVTLDGFTWNGPNKVLWQGAPNYMGSGQSIALSEPVSLQLTGIVLVWSRYADGAAKNDSWSYQFIPKWHVNVHETEGVYFSMPISNTSNAVCNKYVYVEDAMISGHADNTATGTGYANNTRVLRAVLGV